MKRNLSVLVVAAIAGSIAAGAMQSLLSAFAVQNELVPPTSGIFTGVQYSQKLGDALRSLASCNKGATAPANVNGSAVDGLCWIDDSGSPWVVKQYVNGGWAVTGYLDPANSSYAGIVGGGLGSIAAASTTDLGSVAQATVSITGTTTINGFGASAPDGSIKFVRFGGALKLVNSTALAVPGGYDLTTAAGDRAVVTHLGAGNWEITQYTRASGIPIDVAAVGKYAFSGSEAVPPLHLRGDGSALSRATYPAYFAKVTRAQNGTRTSGNATITAVADTTGFGAGMLVEGTGIGAGCTIASLVANTSITLNSGSCVTSSGTSTVRVFLTGYGVGGDTTTVGLPGCEGRMLAGRDPTGANITSAGSGINGAVFNAYGGVQSSSIADIHLPNVTRTVSVDASTAVWNTVAAGSSVTTAGNSGSFGYVTSIFNGGSSGGGLTNYSSKPGLFSGSITATVAINGGVTQQAFNKMPPTLIADCVVRVTP